MRKTSIAVTALLAAAAIAWAGVDPWKTKSADQWTEKDINEILQTSPWAKVQLKPQGAGRPDGMSQMSGSLSTPGGGSDKSHVTSGANPDQMGGTEKEDAAAANQASY